MKKKNRWNQLIIYFTSHSMKIENLLAKVKNFNLRWKSLESFERLFIWFLTLVKSTNAYFAPTYSLKEVNLPISFQWLSKFCGIFPFLSALLSRWRLIKHAVLLFDYRIIDFLTGGGQRRFLHNSVDWYSSPSQVLMNQPLLSFMNCELLICHLLFVRNRMIL